jgi:hypothetical protein
MSTQLQTRPRDRLRGVILVRWKPPRDRESAGRAQHGGL